ncbi:MAG: site-2 protease family protein [Clostridiaceae bacterium]
MNFDLFSIVVSIPAILVAFTFHEYAHAFVADRLGDKTARFQGRLTFNPLVHIDPFGFIMILLFGFGWAKPTPVNTRAFKNYRADDLKVSFAGPLANLAAAFIFTIITAIFWRVSVNIDNIFKAIFLQMLWSTVIINVNLFFFNLLPVPGFDGYRILEDLFPEAFLKIRDQLYRYQMILFFIVVFFAWKIISIPSEAVQDILNKLFIAVANFI